MQKKDHYNYSESKAEQIHAYARTLVSTLPMTDAIKKMVSDSAKLLNSTLEALGTLHSEMDSLTSQASGIRDRHEPIRFRKSNLFTAHC